VGPLPFYFLGLVVLLLLSAFFSGSEAALFSLSRTQIRALKERSPGGKLTARLLEHPRALLVTILICNLTVNVFAASFATSLSLRTFGEAGLWIAFFGMSLVIMLATEVVPKVLGLHWSERVAPVVSAPLALLHTILLPIRIPLGALSDAVTGPFAAIWERHARRTRGKSCSRRCVSRAAKGRWAHSSTKFSPTFSSFAKKW